MAPGFRWPKWCPACRSAPAPFTRPSAMSSWPGSLCWRAAATWCLAGGALVATGRWRAMGRGQPLCLPGFGNDRDRPRRRNLDAAQHHRRVRLGSPALRRAGSRLRNPLRPDCHRPRGRPGRDSSDRQLPGQLRRPRCPGRSASSAGNRDRTRSVGRPPWRAACRGQRLRGLRGGVTSCLRSGPQNRR